MIARRKPSVQLAIAQHVLACMLGSPADFEHAWVLTRLYRCSWWAETAERPDGLGYDLLFVELGGEDWDFDLNDPAVTAVYPLASQSPGCNSLMYRGPLAALQPNWKNVPVCVEGGTSGKLKRWSRIHRYSPAGATTFQGWPIPGGTPLGTTGAAAALPAPDTETTV